MTYVASAALNAYVNRINAREVSFKRYVVREYAVRPGQRHYYEEKAVIWINDGKIYCSAKEMAPTTEEKSAIEHELAVNPPPSSIGARSIDSLKPLMTPGGEIYEIWDRREDLIVMVQHVIRNDDGTKSYVAWSLWNDGTWRRMEPDGKLLFYKPRLRTLAARLMIHEGAKAAAHAQRIVDENLEHPWRNELRLFEHWGMLGGALNPARVKFSEIDGFVEVVYACDNDERGQEALEKVSWEYGKRLKGFRAGTKFPESWDLADQMPEHLFTNGKWSGQTMRQHITPATRATFKVDVRDSKKKVAVLTQDFQSEWIHCVQPEVFIHVDQSDVMYSWREFNDLVAPFSDVEDTARLFRKLASRKAQSLQYVPGKKSGVDVELNRVLFNTHAPSIVEPKLGSMQQFFSFIEHLFPLERDRHNVHRWIATLISKPNRKMLYGLLLISEKQGVGKGTLGEKILAPLVGMNNVSFPNENEIVESQFNYWLSHKRLAMIHEIYSGHSSKAYSRLQSILTDKYVTVNKKHLAAYQIENWVHIFACSNSTRAIYLPDDDRRWFVPTVTEDKQDLRYWTKFYEWLENDDGLGKIRAWSDDFVKEESNVVGPGEPAPWSTRKQRVIDEALPETMRKLAEIFRTLASFTVLSDQDTQDEKEEKERVQQFLKDKKFFSEDHGIMVLDVDLQQFLINRNDGRHDEKIPKLGTICRMARREGWHTSRQRQGRRPWASPTSRFMIEGDYHMLCTSSRTSQMTPTEVFEVTGLRPLDLESLFGQI